TAVQRLTGAEYANASHDLVELRIDARALFPADATGYGFDNIADVRALAPLLPERYLSAAGKISRLAGGDPTQAPVSQEYPVGKYFRQDDRRSEDLPFGSRGGQVVHHYFPVDGEYLLKVYLDRTYQGNVRGLAEEHQLEVRINGERLQTFAVGGGAERDKQASATRSATSSDDPKPPAASGRVRLTPEQIAQRAADIVQQAQVSGQRAEQDHGADANLFVRFRAKAGPATVAVSFVADDALR